MPTDLEHDSPQVIHYIEEENELARQNGLDLADEERDLARSRTAIYQQGLRRYHDRHIRSRVLEPGDLVLRRKQKLDNMNKLSSKWEGPYRVTHTLRPGAVYLEDEKGRPEGNAWNIENLRKFYP